MNKDKPVTKERVIKNLQYVLGIPPSRENPAEWLRVKGIARFVLRYVEGEEIIAKQLDETPRATVEEAERIFNE